MSAIWRETSTGWELAAPVDFPDEKALHDRVEESPQLLPLSGSPSLVVLGREVRLGNGFVDLLAVEAEGRLVVIEVKLKGNPESRRAVVAQVLTYAAHLRGLTPADLADILAPHLRKQGHADLHDLVAATDQAGHYERNVFDAGLAASLATGRFRLVIVMDEAPEELVRLVGYLEAVTDSLVIDLVSVNAYEVGGTRVLVPQRVDPERVDIVDPAPRAVRPGSQGVTESGADRFISSIATAEPEDRDLLQTLGDWACELESEGLCRLETYQGAGNGRLTLLPRLQPDNAGLVTIWNDRGRGALSVWRTVFERRAPAALSLLDSRYGADFIRQGNTLATIDASLLAAFTDAYREANSGAVAT